MEKHPVTVALMVDARADRVEALKSDAVPAFATTDQLFLLEPGDTPFHDAVYGGLNKLLQVRSEGIRAFVLITATDRASSRSVSDIRELLKDQDIQFFVVALGESFIGLNDATRELLRELAETSGGKSFFPRGSRVPESIYPSITRDLQYQYEIGYRPTNTAQDGKWRKVEVSVQTPRNMRNSPRLKARAKPGYYAPTVVSPENR